MSLCVKLHPFQCISGDVTPHTQRNERGHWPSLRRHLQHDGVHDKRHELWHHVVNVQFVELRKTSYRKAINASKYSGTHTESRPLLETYTLLQYNLHHLEDSRIQNWRVWLKCKFLYRTTNTSKHKKKKKSYCELFNAKLDLELPEDFKTQRQTKFWTRICGICRF